MRKPVREREGVKEKERRRESRAHTLALSCLLSLSFSLILVSIRKTSKSQRETGKQPPESCPTQSMEQMSLTLVTILRFLAKKLNGNGACGWS